jgi:hypothetical protein
VQHGAAFGYVDPIAAEHGVATAGQIGGLGQFDQRGAIILVHLGLGIIKQKILKLKREIRFTISLFEHFCDISIRRGNTALFNLAPHMNLLAGQNGPDCHAA